MSAFAKQKGLSRFLLSVWLRRSAEPVPAAADASTPVTWQEAPLHELLGPSPWAAEVVLPGGITVRLNAHGQAQLLGYLHRHLNRC